MKRLIFGITIVFFTILSSINFSYAVNRILDLYGNGGYEGCQGYVDCGSGASLNFGTGDFSVEFWCKLRTNQRRTYIGKQGGGWTNAGWRVTFEGTGTGIQFHIADGVWYRFIGYDPGDYEWHHVAAIRKGTTAYLFVDGVQRATATDASWGANVDNSVTLKLGWLSGWYCLNGLIDEVSIWNKALTQEDIQKTMDAKLHGDEEGLAGYWNFDSGAANDLSPNGNHGTLMGDAKIIPPLNRALDLDGDGDYVEIPDSDVYETSTGTMTLWVSTTTDYSKSTQESDYIIGKQTIYSTFALYFPGASDMPGSTGKIHFWIRDSSGSNNIVLESSTNLNDGRWHFIAIQWGSSGMKLYIDGVLDKFNPFTGWWDGNSANLCLGAINIGYHFGGKIDEVRIWNRALTQMEIYAQKDAILKGDEPGLVGYWRLDEEPGSTIAHDSSGNGNDGTVYGDATFVVSDAPLSTGALVSIPSVSGERGKTVDVPVKVENITKIVSLDLLLSYDANILTPGVAETTDLTTDWQIDSYKTAPGAFKVTIVNHSQPTEDGVMINIPFAVNPNAPACITTPITIEQALLNEGHIPVTTFDGIFNVMSRLGDVSLNGTVTGYDAALVLQHTVKIINLTDCQQKAADVDISGEVTAYDAAIILQYVVGRISSLPPEGLKSPAITENDARIVLPYVDFGSNQPIIVPIAIEQKTPLVSAIELTLSYGDLKPVRVQKTVLTNGYALAYNIQNGEIKIALAGCESIQQSGAFVQVEFELPSQSIINQLSISHIRLNNKLLPSVVTNSNIQIPQKSALLQNFPNPFNPETWIPFQLADEADVVIQIYNLKGELVCTLSVGYKPAGSYLSKEKAAFWNGKNQNGEAVANGVYFYTLKAGEFQATRKMTLVK